MIIYLLRDRATGQFRQKDGSYSESFANVQSFAAKADADVACLENEIVRGIAGDTQLFSGT